MRIAVVSDIHGNLTAFEAVLADLRTMSPDLVLHGGDLTDSGSGPVEVLDQIRALGWRGVLGNTDEMLWRPESLTEFAAGRPHLKTMFDAIEEMAAFTRQELGQARLDWLTALPRVQLEGPMSLVHIAPEPLGKPIAVYGHIHTPFVREEAGATVVNTGSVGLPYDGDRRASYLILDELTPSIRRVEYEVDREIEALRASGLPHSDWMARTLMAAAPQAL